jgi:hypothetical protein
MRRRRGFLVHRTHESIHFQRTWPGQLRQASLGEQAHADHLAEAITRMHVAEGKECVMECTRLDQWHAKGVAPDRCALGDAFDALHSASRRHAVGIAAIEQRLAAGKAGQ